MKLDKAKRLIEAEYEKAKKLEWVHNPVAYALYQVWKMADADPQPRKAVNDMARYIDAQKKDLND